MLWSQYIYITYKRNRKTIKIPDLTPNNRKKIESHENKSRKKTLLI